MTLIDPSLPNDAPEPGRCICLPLPEPVNDCCPLHGIWDDDDVEEWIEESPKVAGEPLSFEDMDVKFTRTAPPTDEERIRWMAAHHDGMGPIARAVVSLQKNVADHEQAIGELQRGNGAGREESGREEFPGVAAARAAGKLWEVRKIEGDLSAVDMSQDDDFGWVTFRVRRDVCSGLRIGATANLTVLLPPPDSAPAPAQPSSVPPEQEGAAERLARRLEARAAYLETGGEHSLAQITADDFRAAAAIVRGSQAVAPQQEPTVWIGKDDLAALSYGGPFPLVSPRRIKPDDVPLYASPVGLETEQAEREEDPAHEFLANEIGRLTKAVRKLQTRDYELTQRCEAIETRLRGHPAPASQAPALSVPLSEPGCLPFPSGWNAPMRTPSSTPPERPREDVSNEALIEWLRATADYNRRHPLDAGDARLLNMVADRLPASVPPEKHRESGARSVLIPWLDRLIREIPRPDDRVWPFTDEEVVYLRDIRALLRGSVPPEKQQAGERERLERENELVDLAATIRSVLRLLPDPYAVNEKQAHGAVDALLAAALRGSRTPSSTTEGE